MTKTLTIRQELYVRVWREESIDASAIEIDHAELIAQIKDLVQIDDTTLSLAKKVLALPNVNAVEVLRRDGNGTVLYRDWP